MSYLQRELDFDSEEIVPETEVPVEILPACKSWIDSWQGDGTELRRSKSGDNVLVWIAGNEIWFPKHRVVSR